MSPEISLAVQTCLDALVDLDDSDALRVLRVLQAAYDSPPSVQVTPAPAPAPRPATSAPAPRAKPGRKKSGQQDSVASQVLDLLKRKGPMSPKEIAKALSTDAQHWAFRAALKQLLSQSKAKASGGPRDRVYEVAA